MPLQVEEVVLDDTEQCQQNPHFIKKLLDDIINNALGKSEKLSDTTKITTCHTNEMWAIVQKFTAYYTPIPITNDLNTQGF